MQLIQIIKSTSIKKLLKYQNLAEISWLIFGQAISIVLGFISIKLLSSMGPKEFGKYSLVLTIAAFISAILYGPAEQGFIRFYYEYSNKGLAQTYMNLFYRFLFFAGCLCFLTTILAIPISSIIHSPERPIEIIIIGLFIIISTSSNISNSMLNLLRKRKTNTILQMSERILMISFLFLISISTKLTATTGFCAIIFALLIVFILKIIVLKNYIPRNKQSNFPEFKKIKKDIINIVKAFSIPFAIWGITGWLQSNSERWIIATYLSTTDVGIFAIMATLSNYLIVIPSGIISQFAQPIIFERISATDNPHKREEGIKFLKYLVISLSILILLSTLFTIILGKQLILLVSNKDFINSWYILPILCIGMGIFQLGQMLTTIGIIHKVPNKYLLSKITTGIFALLSNIFFIVKMGMVGISISICITSTFYLLFILHTNSNIKAAFKI